MQRRRPARERGAGMPKEVNGETAFTIQELELMLQVTGKTLRRWCAEGRLEAFRIGRQWLVTEGALEAFKIGPASALPVRAMERQLIYLQAENARLRAALAEGGRRRPASEPAPMPERCELCGAPFFDDGPHEIIDLLLCEDCYERALQASEPAPNDGA
jgi:excisionase family DNA binding protein